MERSCNKQKVDHTMIRKESINGKWRSFQLDRKRFSGGQCKNEEINDWRTAQALANEAKHMLQAMSNKKQWHEPKKA